MAIFTKTKLSASTDGKGILVAATSNPGTLIHTGSSESAIIDELWIYGMNTDTTARKLTLQWGGVSSPSDDIEITLSAESGLVLLSPGLMIQGNATPLVVRAFAAAANVITIHGYTHRITP
jgi:hypothetical protein